MKKTISVLIIFSMLFAALFALSSCSKKIYFSEEKYMENLSKDNESYSEALSLKNKAIDDAKADILEDFGNSEKDKTLVVRLIYGIHEEYIQYVFKKGVSKEKYMYIFYDNDTDYNMKLEAGDDGNDKLVGHDNEKRMLKYKSSNVAEVEYDTLYQRYADMDPDICTIIEG